MPVSMQGMVVPFGKRRVRLKSSVSAFAYAAALAAAGGYSTTASAQQVANPPASSANQLEEVTVTARYTTEDIQKTPLAISTLDTAQLESRGYTQTSDIGAAIPGVTFEPLGDHYGSGVTAYIRGVGQTDSGPTWSPAVGFYVDDVYVGSLAGSNSALLDVDNIAVLPGPQGTLFGANSESGAVRISSVLPRGDDSGFAEVGYGSYNHFEAKAGIDLPLVADKLFLRVAASEDRQDGWQNIVDFACKYPSRSGTLKPITSVSTNCILGTQGGHDTQAAKATLLWKAADDLTVTIHAGVDNEDNEVPATTLLSVLPGPFTNNPNYLFLGQFAGKNFGIPIDSRFVSPNIFTTYETYRDAASGRYFAPDDPAFVYNFSGGVDWDPLPGLHVKSVTAYRNTSTTGVDGFGFPLPFVNAWQEIDGHQFTQELDFSGKLFDDRLEWTLGGFYYRAYYQLDSDVDAPILPNPYAEFYAAGRSPTENKSGFVHGIYHITDELSLEAGFRLTALTKSYSIEQHFLPTWVAQYPLLTQQSDTTRPDWRAAIQYQVDPDAMLYASYATGWKGGGVNPEVIYSTLDFTPFGPETVKDYEVGAKTEWFDHHFRLNADLFRMDYTGLQVQANRTLAVFPFDQSLVENVGSATIDGAELSAEARPWRGLALNAAGAYIHYKTEDCGAACLSAGGTVPDGAIAPQTPKWKINLGAQYAFDLGDQGSLTPRIDYTFQSKVYFEIANITSQGDYGVANLHIAWTDAQDKWGATFAVTNLLDRVYYTSKYYFAAGAITGNPGDPREFMFTLRRNFGGESSPSPEMPSVAPTPMATPTAPPPAPIVETQRQFQVFFDFDKSDVTAAAAQVIQKAADSAKAGNLVHITVTGHTDTVGSASYNQGLSERRAAAVKAKMVEDGVPGGEIATLGVGKTGLLVPTADGVREPQNRRAEIQLAQ